MLHALLEALQAKLGLEDHPWLDEALERGTAFGEGSGRCVRRAGVPRSRGVQLLRLPLPPPLPPLPPPPLRRPPTLCCPPTAAAAIGFLVVDVFLCFGPLRFPLLRLFNQHGQGKDAQRRFLSQVGAGRLVVCTRGPEQAPYLPPTRCPRSVAALPLHSWRQKWWASSFSQPSCHWWVGRLLYARRRLPCQRCLGFLVQARLHHRQCSRHSTLLSFLMPNLTERQIERTNRPSCLPQAFQALADPALGAGQRFSATTPVSRRMVEVGAGYFLYDIVICLLKFGGGCGAAWWEPARPCQRRRVVSRGAGACVHACRS